MSIGPGAIYSRSETFLMEKLFRPLTFIISFPNPLHSPDKSPAAQGWGPLLLLSLSAAELSSVSAPCISHIPPLSLTRIIQKFRIQALELFLVPHYQWWVWVTDGITVRLSTPPHPIVTLERGEFYTECGDFQRGLTDVSVCPAHRRLHQQQAVSIRIRVSWSKRGSEEEGKTSSAHLQPPIKPTCHAVVRVQRLTK